MVAIANYFASVSVRPDEKGLKAVDNYLKAIENKLRKGTNGNGTGKGLVLNVSINQRFLRKSIADTIEKGVFRAKITPVLNKGSLQAIKQQIQSVFATPINIKVNPTATRTPRAVGGTRTGTTYSWSPNAAGKRGATPHLTEWLAGRPDKSSLSAANRRYSDSIMNRGFFGPDGAPKTLRGFMGETVLGGLGRMGSSTLAGRGLSSLGGALGGARLGAAGLIGGAALKGITTAAKGVWSGMATIVTAPFKLIGGAANMVTSGFYRLALSLAPLVGGFMMLNRTVQLSSQRQIALNTVSQSLGSSGKEESSWLMNMANRDGMRYNTLIDPYTTFIASASPAMGLGGAKDVFESFTQFGLTRGANDISMGLAMKAVSQMAGKGRVQAEELRGQLGDAPGFGEMQGIFAQAYQRVLGRDEKTAKKGQEAIAELNKAMEKGLVISDKILPHVAKIAKELAEPGLAEARAASFAEQARFANQISKGWANFREGGGEAGLAYFWRMMQQMGSWWENNGSSLGRYFEILMVDLNTLRVGLKEFFEFAWTGEQNDLTEILQKSLGIDAVALRGQIIEIGGQISDLFERLAVALGFKKEGSYVKGISDKFAVFMENFSKILKHVDGMLGAIERFLLAWNNFSALPMQTKIGAILPGTAGNKELSNMINAAGSFVANGVGATFDAGKAQIDVLSGSSGPTQQPSIIPQAPYRRPDAWGDNSVPSTPLMRESSPSQVTPSKHEININISSDTNSQEAMEKMEQVATGVFQKIAVGAIVQATIT